MLAPLDTVPLPLPDLLTVSVTVGRLLKGASSETSWTIVNVHVGDVPAHAPLQEPKEEIGSACTVRVTVVPGMYVRRHVEPQETPDPKTVPPPAPERVTVNVTGAMLQWIVTFPLRSYETASVPGVVSDRLQGLPAKSSIPARSPAGPIAPVSPFAPVAPAGPAGPVAPVAPFNPAPPTSPFAPVAPTAPVAPVAPASPLLPVAPVGPTLPVAPAGPTDPVAPVAPVAPVRPWTPCSFHAMSCSFVEHV